MPKGDTKERPLDAIERRAKALGWEVVGRRDRQTGEILSLSRDIRGVWQYASFYESGESCSASPSVCRHELELLKRDCEAAALLRGLIAKANAAEAMLSEMRSDIAALQGLNESVQAEVLNAMSSTRPA